LQQRRPFSRGARARLTAAIAEDATLIAFVALPGEVAFVMILDQHVPVRVGLRSHALEGRLRLIEVFLHLAPAVDIGPGIGFFGIRRMAAGLGERHRTRSPRPLRTGI
jgi:hypothetical protein